MELGCVFGLRDTLVCDNMLSPKPIHRGILVYKCTSHLPNVKT